MTRRAVQLGLLGLLGLGGLASVGWGLAIEFGVVARPSVAVPGEPGGAVAASPGGPPPAVAPVGSGVWDHPAPAASAPKVAPCSGCDIVVITVCSLRRDHLGIYGATGDPTPHIDALMGGAWRLDNAWAASNFTLAGLTALLTGRFGSSTGVTGWDKGLVKDVPTLPEVLGLYGYATGGFTIDAPSGFRPDYGLDRGFQRMEILPPPRDTPDGRSQGGEIGPGGASARPAAAWIAAQDRSRPMFAMFHSRTAHYPFVIEDDAADPTGIRHLLFTSGDNHVAAAALPGVAGGTAQRGVVALRGEDPVQVAVRKAGPAGERVWREEYRAAVTRMDLDVGVVEQALRERGRLDRTIIVLLADHGESLGDHGELLHGDAYYDGVVHIPMLVRVPGQPGRPSPALVSQVDVLPTLLGLVGAVPPADIDGASMLPLFDGSADRIRATTLVEGGVSWHDDGVPRGAVVSPPWAMLRQDRGCDGGESPGRAPGRPATCLYNLEDDPRQVKNLALAHPEVVKELSDRWAGFVAAHADASNLTLDPAYVEELHKNGYDFRPGDK